MAIEHFLEKLVDLLTETAPTESGNYWHLLTKLIIFFIASVLWKDDKRIAIRWNGSGNNSGTRNRGAEPHGSYYRKKSLRRLHYLSAVRKWRK